MFSAFDPQRTGYVTCLDFRILLEQAGTFPSFSLSLSFGAFSVPISLSYILTVRTGLREAE
ncbi:unnamed protein product [Dibothriocephalus latus]|uniref:EF-hand domain-containing protein n=1 Tax=Dibothriocephalus latus TaxID=60516 RepID=A0A3P7Q1N4_DIBLA|nr:unnamed protein product [Dibothriocephalus latus]